MRSGVGFTGEPDDGSVALAVNYHPGWGPDPEQVDWSTSVSAETGEASFENSSLNLGLATAAVGLLGVAFVLIGLGRARR